MQVEVPPPPLTGLSSIPNSYALPPLAITSKKRKRGETSTSPIQAIDLDDFKFEKFILKEVMMLNTLIIYFNKGIFKRPELIWDLYSHFGSDVEQASIKEARREKNASNGEMMVDRLLEVNSYSFSTSLFYPLLYSIISLHLFPLLVFYQVLALAREGEISFKAYKHKVHECCLQIVKYQKDVKDKDTFLVENETKILSLEGDVLNKSKKLKKAKNYANEYDKRISH